MKTVRVLNGIVNAVILLLLLALVAWGIYTWADSALYFEEASSDRYDSYSPGSNEGLSALQKENGEVIGWLKLDGTDIDYPLVRSEQDNQFYLKRNALKEPSASGAIFWDARQAADLSEFCSFIYGHYMENHKMFGDLSLYFEQSFFDAHDSASLTLGTTTYRLNIVGALKANSYDNALYIPHVTQDQEDIFLQHLETLAVFTRGTLDRSKPLLILSSCAEDTNGRYALLCQVTGVANQTYSTPSAEKHSYSTERFRSLSSLQIVAVLLMLILLTASLYRFSIKRTKR